MPRMGSALHQPGRVTSVSKYYEATPSRLYTSVLKTLQVTEAGTADYSVDAKHCESARNQAQSHHQELNHNQRVEAGLSEIFAILTQASQPPPLGI